MFNPHCGFGVSVFHTTVKNSVWASLPVLLIYLVIYFFNNRYVGFLISVLWAVHLLSGLFLGHVLGG